MIAAFAAAPAPASAAGMAAFVRPAFVHPGMGGHGGDFHAGRQHAFGRHRDVIGLPIIAPTNVEPPAASAEAPQPFDFAPAVIAAPQCVPPRIVESSRARVIYVNEALAAPSREQQGVTIIYGRAGW
jgi:hypothetical protein